MQGSGTPGRQCSVARCVGGKCTVTWGHLQGMTAVPLIVVTVPFSPILGLADAREVR